MKKIDKLTLNSLTLHGNPVEQITNFRLFLIGTIKSVKKLDNVLISKKERDNARVYIEQFKHIPKPIENPMKPPTEQ